MTAPSTKTILDAAAEQLRSLQGHIFDVLDLNRPITPDAAVNLSKIISKLSPIVGNMIEFNTVELLNNSGEFTAHGEWRRQDPGFPDTVFDGQVTPTPGFEIKAWFPLATEMTARFRDSQNHFAEDNTHVAILAWLPERVIYGRPRILGVCVVSGLSVARARDQHYHDPPDYVVLEPEDTSRRTRNLQQTNTAGYKWQGTPEELTRARDVVRGWGTLGASYQPTREYQGRVRELTAKYNYRLDTNFAKLDRIVHDKIEVFKKAIYDLPYEGLTVREWNKLFASGNNKVIRYALEKHLGIKEDDADKLVL